MKSGLITVGITMFALSVVMPHCAWASSDAALAGVVRDAQGTPQMGALIELVGPDASVVRRAFTDEHGRYLLNALVPGTYQLRASAAFLAPAMQGNLHLLAGVHAVANLTLAALFSTGAWLPAERRPVTEPADDWRWTLRSRASRPLLRLVGGTGAAVVTAAADGQSGQPHKVDGHASLLAGTGAFGEGNVQQVVTLDRASMEGAVEVLRASFGTGSSAGSAASFSVAGGAERPLPFGGEIRMLASFVEHPGIQGPNATGTEALRTAETEKILLGDAVVVDAGTLFSTERLLGSRFESDPFARVAFRATPELTFEYRLATDRCLQRSEDLDGAVLPDDVLSDAQGRPLSHRGLHQELVATKASGVRSVSVAVFRDSADWEGVQGSGQIGREALVGVPVIADSATGTLRLAVPGFVSTGARASFTEQITPAFSASIEADLGRALTGAPGVSLAETGSTLAKTRRVVAVAAFVHIQMTRSATTVDVSYRWQPGDTLTQVAEYDTAPTNAFLGLRLRQRIWSGRQYRGINAILEASNLLAEGYQPVIGPDGQTLFLAQVPRSMVTGLAFNF